MKGIKVLSGPSAKCIEVRRIFISRKELLHGQAIATAGGHERGTASNQVADALDGMLERTTVEAIAMQLRLTRNTVLDANTALGLN